MLHELQLHQLVIKSSIWRSKIRLHFDSNLLRSLSVRRLKKYEIHLLLARLN